QFNASVAQQQQQSYFTSPKIPPNSNANAPFPNFQHRSQPMKQDKALHFENAFSQRTFDDFSKSKNEVKDSMTVDPNMESEFE
ncbi:hypothetical protein ACXWQ2_09465, partial [Streptococcus pyogenes]